MSVPVKVVIAEPSVIIRSGMLAVLRQISSLHLEVFEANDLEQLKNTLAWRRPDVLIVNPSILGLYSLHQIRKEMGNKDLKCVALQSSLADAASLKTYDEALSIYDSAEQIGEKLSQLVLGPTSDRRHESLSPREKEVIVCVIKGMTNKQIADKLCLSTHTVITHRRNISSKLDIHSTAGLTIYAIVNQLVDLNDVKDTE